jgi:formate hydrogenlyase subunit 6/NADH:ubiquinone oxidoreductase subunit I
MSREMISVFIMGKEYRVPANLTILKATEYAGYRMIRGCGCRGGICGACATVYRLPGDYRIQVGLACQTLVADGMRVAQIPFFPANKAGYDVEKLTPSASTVLSLYPEIARCLCCNTCTKACPQDLEVMDYVQAALRGDVEKAAELSFECIMCGLCAARCPAEIVQYNIGLLCRRLYGRHILPRAKHLKTRVGEIARGKFKKEMEKLTGAPPDKLRKMYAERDIEPL